MTVTLYRPFHSALTPHAAPFSMSAVCWPHAFVQGLMRSLIAYEEYVDHHLRYPEPSELQRERISRKSCPKDQEKAASKPG
jgi:hypothetical protein